MSVVATSLSTMTWTAAPLATLDFETTGVDPLNDRVVSVAALAPDSSGISVVGTVNPGVPIPARSSAVHGIHDADVVDAPSPATAIAQVIAWVDALIRDGIGLVVYNAPYDLTMLRAEARRHGIGEPDWRRLRVVDPLVLDWVVDRFRRGKRTLSATAEHYGVLLLDAHDAVPDAVAARELAIAIGSKYPEVGGMDLDGVTEAQRGWYRSKTQQWNEWIRRQPGGAQRRLDDPEAWPVA